MQLVDARRVPFEQDRGQPPYENLRDLRAGMRHIAFNLPRDRFDSIVGHVKSWDVDVIGPALPPGESGREPAEADASVVNVDVSVAAGQSLGLKWSSQQLITRSPCRADLGLGYVFAALDDSTGARKEPGTTLPVSLWQPVEMKDRR